MLAPGVERAAGAAHDFAIAGRDLYPEYLAALRDATGIDVPLNRDGILEVLSSDGEAESRRGALAPDSEWIEPERLRALEPQLAPMSGAILYLHDGAVDNVVLLDVLRRLVARLPEVTVIAERATAIAANEEEASVTTSGGRIVAGDMVVLAAGAWVTELRGLPRPIPVEPVRGQMISYAAAPLSHVTYGPGGYLVPRADGRTVVGATMERTGFDDATTPEAATSLARAAAELSPPFAGARVLDQWSGLRPVTPDFLPIIGRDPEHPSLLYACGHSRNGILLAPVTAVAVAALATGATPGWDLSPFSIERFAAER
jgi:glycine oxidase